jgi:hypothetical protein
MKKKILIAGCSHVSGHGFEDSITGVGLSKYAWPAMIEKDFDVEVFNYSKPGASPDYCIEKIQNFDDKQSLSAILVMLPHSSRSLKQIVRDDGTIEDEFYHHGYISTHDRWDKIMAAYYKICHNWRTDNVNMLAYAGYLNFISTTYNIPLWVTTTTSSDQMLLTKHKFQLEMTTDWMTYCTKHRFSRLPDGHFGHDAHIDFYKRYVKQWLVKNLI